MNQKHQTTTNRSLNQWLDLLESRHPVAIDLGLERVAEVYERLGGARPAAKVITIGGTNGKGSCVALLSNLLTAAGYRTGTYTSPHILAFNERINIAGISVSDRQLCAAFAELERARGDISLTYFEFTTLAAFLIMSRANLDFALLEVGLGGRLDAVNIIDPDISAITSIDIDHQEWLGNTREQVAIEKCGIARPRRPLVCGESNPPATVASELDRSGATGWYIGRQFQFEKNGDEICGWVTDSDGKLQHYDKLPTPELPLPSAACALQVLALLDIHLQPSQVGKVFTDTLLPGRFQKVMCDGVQLILDVAHNPAAARQLSQQLANYPGSPEIAVFAIMADKDVGAVIESCQPGFSHWIVADLPDNSRAARATDLAGLLYNAGAEASIADTVAHALDLAMIRADSGETIVVFGSFYTVAAALEWLRTR